MDKATILRFLKKKKVFRKLAERMKDRQNNEPRLIYQAEALPWTADLLVFIDEFLFNKATGWRLYAYTPLGQPGQYYVSRSWRHSWSVLPVYTINDYLFFRRIQKEWFNTEGFYRWLADELLTHYCPKQIIIMNKDSIYCNKQVEEFIQAYSLKIYYLPLCLPDLNTIELTLCILKA